MFFVEARYHRDPARAGGQVRYIAHREEGLTDGQRRELYGIGSVNDPVPSGATRRRSGRGSVTTAGVYETRSTSASS